MLYTPCVLGVAGVPSSSFFKEDVHHLVRFHFAKKDETLYDEIIKFIEDLDRESANSSILHRMSCPLFVFYLSLPKYLI